MDFEEEDLILKVVRVALTTKGVKLWIPPYYDNKEVSISSVEVSFN